MILSLVQRLFYPFNKPDRALIQMLQIIICGWELCQAEIIQLKKIFLKKGETFSVLNRLINEEQKNSVLLFAVIAMIGCSD